MDAQVVDSELSEAGRTGWFAREKASGRVYQWAMIGSAVALMAILAFSYMVLSREAAPGSTLSAPSIAALLVANLIPSIALMVLLSRKIARDRAMSRGIGTGQLHTRLVALFSVIAAVPTVIVAIFASLLLQSGLEFWFSDRARGMLENTVQIAQAAYTSEVNRVGAEAVTMVGDFYDKLGPRPMQNPLFDKYLGYQTFVRSLNESAIVTVDAQGQMKVDRGINYYDGLIDPSQVAPALAQLKGETQAAEVVTRGRIAVITPMNNDPGTYLFVARQVDDDFRRQIGRATGVLADYRTLIQKSRANQLNFNAALLLGALVIVALAIFTALKLADRLLRPVEELVDAAGRVEEGDLATRVPINRPADEIAMLGTAFNRMTGRLQQQTGALIAANEQLDTRRAFIEAVLSSVTAGVIAVDRAGSIQLTNRSAETLLSHGEESIEGKELAEVSVELREFLDGETRDANVLVHSGEVQRTLAVKRMRYADGSVLTFDDITDQLSDQRRAAWSDIADGSRTRSRTR